MKPITIGLIGFMVFAGWTSFSRYHFMCKMLSKCDDTTAIASQMERSKDLTFTADGEPVLKDHEQFGFEPNSSSPILTDDNKKFIDELEKHLKANPKQQLTITGFYTEAEKGQEVGIYENLGVARAVAIREELTNRGIKNPIALDHKMIGDLSKPLTFSAKTLDTPDEYDNAENQQFVFTNMNFSEINFDYNSSVFNPNQAFNNYADSVKTYFTENPDKVLTVIGHTDIKGGDDYNMTLGLNRAKAVRQYLIDKIGMTGKSIKTASKGKREPAFLPAEDEANMAKNRRVNIKID